MDETRPLHVLMIDDDVDHAMLIRLALEEHGWPATLEHAIDAEEGLRYLRAQPPHGERTLPDLVLLDLNMPGIGGQEMLALMKEDAELRMLPVVVLTTSDADADRHEAYRNHVNSYLVKPVSFDALMDMLANVKQYWGKWNRPSPSLCR